MPDSRRRLDKISGEISPQPNVPPTLAGEPIGKDPKKIEREWREMVVEDATQIVAMSGSVRERVDASPQIPLSEHNLSNEEMLALIVSYLPEEPPDHIGEEAAGMYARMVDDPALNQIEQGHMRSLLDACKDLVARGRIIFE